MASSAPVHQSPAPPVSVYSLKPGSGGSSPPIPAALKRLPPFSPIAGKLLAMLGQDQVKYKEVADLILLDAAFSTGLLRLANSAMIGARFPVSSVMQALAMLGINRVSALVTTISLNAFLRPEGAPPLLGRCWRHNLATAVAASSQAEKYGLDPDEAYIHGLLHDIGTLGLLAAYPWDYPPIVDQAAKAGVDRSELEHKRFHITHAEAAEWLAKAWNLPPGLAAPMPGKPMHHLVEFSCHAADDAGFPISEHSPAPPAAATTEEEDLRAFVGERVSWCERAYGEAAAA